MILCLVPPWMDMRKMNYEINKQGIFLNAIEYPAVPSDQQRFRISIMAEHTKDDIDKLIDIIENFWTDENMRIKD